jgi:hypothetical protein
VVDQQTVSTLREEEPAATGGALVVDAATAKARKPEALVVGEWRGQSQTELLRDAARHCRHMVAKGARST